MDDKQCFVNYALRKITYTTLLFMLLFVVGFLIITLVNSQKTFSQASQVYNRCKYNGLNKRFKISRGFVPGHYTKIFLTLLISDSHK